MPNLIGRTLLKNALMTIPLRSGARLAVDTSQLDIYCRIDLDRGVWDGNILDVCLRALRPDDVFYDIGANVGVFSVECATKFPGIIVHAFEPQPSLAKRIRHSAELNNIHNLSVHEILLSDKAGEGQLYIGRQSVHASMIPRERQTRAVIPRELIPLDTFVDRENLPPPALIKIDVEGAELGVFHGASRTIAAHKPVIVFEADQNMRRFGYDHATLFASLRDLADYLILRIGPDASLHRLPADGLMEEGNYVAVPPQRPDLIPSR